MLLDQLKPAMISAAYSKALTSGRVDGKGGLSARTVHHMHTVLKAALEQAVTWEMLPRNPAAKVDPPRVAKAPMSTYSMPQVGSLIGQMRAQRVFMPIFLSAMTGMRRGETAAVRWRSVDLEVLRWPSPRASNS